MNSNFDGHSLNDNDEHENRYKDFIPYRPNKDMNSCHLFLFPSVWLPWMVSIVHSMKTKQNE